MTFRLSPAARVFGAALALISAAGAAPALARPLVGDLPLMNHLMQSCGADIAQHCPDVIPGGGRIAQCLVDQKTELSRACGEVLAQGAALKNAYFACYADAKTHCADVPIGGGQVAACLAAADVSPVCAEAMETAAESWGR